MSWFLNGSKQQPFLFFSALWWIWRYRNNAIFNTVDPWLPEKVIALIRSSSEELLRVFHLQRLSCSSTLKLSWTSPAQGTVTVNSDVCYIESYGTMGFGCVIRDWKGDWKKGCAGSIPPSGILQAFILLNADTFAANNERFANSVADALAKYAVVHGVYQVEWLIPRDDIKELLKRDMAV
ncbi:hypothetical protein PIB30_074034 [Stylosanthes scabra]|uniref:RNase H type-1 domain-containing protein n=1 Tax=Stylosanthes scabra TaxID=79078 RepID=A0ABU6SPQ7_9FABA|nr:hypothetical protein [Stylosanthes scabra]